MRHAWLLCAALLCVGSTVARAQTGLGVLIGSVTDPASGRPSADVVVTAISPALQGEQVTVTDATGNYRLPQLPVGVYALRFELANHRPYLREGIELQAGQTLRLNVQLLPETLSDEVVVTGKPPLVDVGSNQTGLVLTSDFAERIPIVQSTQGGLRNVMDLALAAPQTQRDLFGVSINGTTSPENQYLLDGLAVNDTAYGPSGTSFAVEFAQELSVLTGGYQPEYGRTTGGVLSVVSKSGGNEFHGSVFMTYSPGALAQSSRLVEDNNTIFGSRTTLYNAGDVGFTLGGFLVKDKLWFFVGFDPSFQRNSLLRTVSVFDVDSDGNRIPAPGGYQRTEVPSATRRYFQDSKIYPFFGKLTYQVAPEHRITLSVSGTPYRGNAPFERGVDGTFNALGVVHSGGVYDVIGQLSSAFLEKKVLLDLLVGWHLQKNNNRPIDDSWVGSGLATVPSVVWRNGQSLSNFAPLEPGASPELAAICAEPSGATRCRVAGYGTGGPDAVQEIEENRFQARAILTGLFEGLGHHVLKAGIDLDVSDFDKTPLIPGGARYDGFGSPTDATLVSTQFGYLAGPDTPVAYASGVYSAKTRSVTIGGFVQDSWNVLDRLTLNLGVRYDAETIFDHNRQVAMVLGNQWAPRIGLIWDPTYQGRAKVFASYAWYYEQVPLRLADLALSGRSFVSATYTGCRDPSTVGNGRCDQQGSSVLVPGGAGPTKSWALYSPDAAVDPGVVAPRTDEIVAGVEYAVFAAVRLGFTYTHRDLTHGMEDFSLNEGAKFWIGNPGRGIANALASPARIYNAYTVSVTRSLEDRWLAQASYTFSTLEGNTVGFFSPENTPRDVTQIFPNIGADFDLPILRVNRFGPLPADSRHQIKLHAAYQLQLSPTVGVTLGGVYNGRSGAPISAFGGFPGYGGLTVLIIPRGMVGRLPWVHQVDLHATLDIRLAPATILSVGADCFNVLGSQQVVAVDQSYVFPENTAVVPIVNGTMADLPAKVLLVSNNQPLPQSRINTNFGRASEYQPPRTVRFLARVRF